MSKALNRAFADICNGYTACSINGQTCYIRHLSFRDRLDLDNLQEIEFNKAISMGTPDVKTRMAELKNEGIWTDQNERELLQQVSYVKSMIDGKKTIGIPSLLARHIENIKKEELRLKEMRDKKGENIGLTAESFAQKVVNDRYLYSSFYKDANCSIPLWEDEVFDDLEEDEIQKISEVYDKNINNICSEKNIKLLCIQGFFQSYFVLCNSDISSFYGKSIIQLTFFQTQLANQALYFKQLFENNDISKLPLHVQEDPDLITSYLDTIKKGKEDVSKHKDGNTSYIGTTKEDREALGLQDKRIDLPNKRVGLDFFVQQQQK